VNAYAIGIIAFFALGLAMRFLASHGTMKATRPEDVAAMRARGAARRAHRADAQRLQQLLDELNRTEERR
jgi:hypothetical protein